MPELALREQQQSSGESSGDGQVLLNAFRPLFAGSCPSRAVSWYLEMAVLALLAFLPRSPLLDTSVGMVRASLW